MFRHSWEAPAPQVYVMAKDPAVRHLPSLAFRKTRPEDEDACTVQVCAPAPLQDPVVTAVFPPGCRQRPDRLLTSRKVPFAPGAYVQANP